MNGYAQWPYGDDNMPAVTWTEEAEETSGDASGGAGDDPDVDADSSHGLDPETV